MFGLAILTVSTSGSQGQREDTSGKAISEALEPRGYRVVRYEIVADDAEIVAERLSQWADAADVDLIVTTGGTGLGRRDVTSVLVEGGGTLLGSLFDRGLVDKVVAFVAPVIVGGLAAPSPVAGAGVERLAQARRLDRTSIVQLGPDVAVVGYCEAKSDVHRNS